MRIRNNRGFTLIELLVVIALITILVGLATPRLNRAFDSFQFSNGMRSMFNSMNQAKGEAMNTGLLTTVLFTTDAKGKITYTVFTDDGAGGGTTGNGIRDGSERLIARGTLPGSAKLSSGDTTFQKNGNENFYTQFSSTGFPVGTDPDNGATLKFYTGKITCKATIGGDVVTQAIELGLGGSMKITKV